MGKQYDPNALLYRWTFREDDNLPRLIGTDPELADRASFFRWIDEPGGWDRREPWPHGAVNVETVDNALGAPSGWPGAVPLRGKPGRPRKEVEDDARPVTVGVSFRRADLYQMQRLASDAKKTVGEWVAAVVRDVLTRAAGDTSA